MRTPEYEAGVLLNLPEIPINLLLKYIFFCGFDVFFMAVLR